MAGLLALSKHSIILCLTARASESCFKKKQYFVTPGIPKVFGTLYGDQKTARDRKKKKKKRREYLRLLQLPIHHNVYLIAVCKELVHQCLYCC